MSIGKNIQEFRKYKNLTQKQLAELCGCAEITIRQYENEKREPKLEQIEKIADALGITINTLLGKTNFKVQAGFKIKELREKLGYSLDDISSKSDLSIVELLEIERGNTPIKIKVAESIASSMSLSCEEFLNYISATTEKNTSNSKILNGIDNVISDSTNKLYGTTIYELLIQEYCQIYESLQKLNEKGIKEALKRIDEISRLEEYQN